MKKEEMGDVVLKIGSIEANTTQIMAKFFVEILIPLRNKKIDLIKDYPASDIVTFAEIYTFWKPNQRAVLDYFKYRNKNEKRRT